MFSALQVSTTKDRNGVKKGATAKARAHTQPAFYVPGASADLLTLFPQKALPPVDQKGGVTQTEDILNSILPPREWTEDGQLWVQVLSPAKNSSFASREPGLTRIVSTHAVRVEHAGDPPRRDQSSGEARPAAAAAPGAPHRPPRLREEPLEAFVSRRSSRLRRLGRRASAQFERSSTPSASVRRQNPTIGWTVERQQRHASRRDAATGRYASHCAAPCASRRRAHPTSHCELRRARPRPPPRS